jgi:hypothetical protein
MSKAMIFATAGLAAGIAVGSVGGLVFAATQIPAAVPAPAVPTASPVASAGTMTLPSTAPVASMPAGSAPVVTETGMPPLARSALLQAITVNEELAGASGALRAALATSPFDASGVAEVLRSISADAVYGADLADRVSGWPGSATIGVDLSGIYGTIHDTATNTLVASVRNTTAYRDGARAMVALLARVEPIDSRARDLATDQGVILPEPTAQS